MTEIVKVQQALFPPGAPALVYAKNKAHIRQMELPKAVRDAMGPDAKAYFHAETVDGSWKIGKRAPAQSW